MHGRLQRFFESIYKRSITLSSRVRPLRSKAAIDLIDFRRVLARLLRTWTVFERAGAGSSRPVVFNTIQAVIKSEGSLRSSVIQKNQGRNCE